MAYFSELDSSNTVIRTIVVSDENVAYPKDPAAEQWCKENIPNDPTISLVNGVYPGVAWKQTFLNSNNRAIDRGRYAGPGTIYDPEQDLFLPKKPFASAILDPITFEYSPPVPFPSVDDRGNYLPLALLTEDMLIIGWREENLRWEGYRLTNLTEIKYWDVDSNTWKIA